MGCWGMGISQSDEYCEIYERFMEEYDQGKPVKDITAHILEDYLHEFSPEDGIMHDVYFALAKSQWMCGGIDSDILGRVTRIIESGDNIAFYRELEATEADLKKRQKALEKFLAGLQTPRTTVRKRRRPESAYVPEPRPTPLPAIQPGDLVAYPVKGAWRVLLVSYVRRVRKAQYVNCFLWNGFFPEIPSWEVLEKSPGILLAQVNGDAFPAEFQIIGKRDVYRQSLMGMAYDRLWYNYQSKPMEPHQMVMALPNNLCVPYGIALQKGIDWWNQKTQGQFPRKTE